MRKKENDATNAERMNKIVDSFCIFAVFVIVGLFAFSAIIKYIHDIEDWKIISDIESWYEASIDAYHCDQSMSSTFIAMHSAGINNSSTELFSLKGEAARPFLELVSNSQKIGEDARTILEHTITCSMSLRDMDGRSIGKNSDGEWELSADQDVLVWFDLPKDVDNIYVIMKASYPFEVKADDRGTITVTIESSDRWYVGELDFVAKDELRLGCVATGTNLRNEQVGICNDATRGYMWMMTGKHSYIHFPLYTSCEGDYRPYEVYDYSGRSGHGYYLYSYSIKPIVAGSMELERSKEIRTYDKPTTTSTMEVQKPRQSSSETPMISDDLPEDPLPNTSVPKTVPKREPRECEEHDSWCPLCGGDDPLF